MSETSTQTLARLTAFIQEKAPNIDLSPGSVFNELILGLESQIQNQVYNDIDAISQSQAIKDVLSSIPDTYSPVIDRIASNYNTTRNQGALSVGNIKVSVTSQLSANYTLPSNTTFTQTTLGYTYISTSAITLNSGSLVHDTTSGLYYFIIPVTATEIGLHTQLSNGAQFVINKISTIPNFVKAEAYGSFSAGLDQETDRQLITRFKNGLSVNNLLSSVSINSKLASEFTGFRGAFIADTTSPINVRSCSPEHSSLFSLM